MIQVYRRGDRRLIPLGETSLAIAPITHDGQSYDTLGAIVLRGGQDPSVLPDWKAHAWASDIEARVAALEARNSDGSEK